MMSERDLAQHSTVLRPKAKPRGKAVPLQSTLALRRSLSNCSSPRSREVVLGRGIFELP